MEDDGGRKGLSIDKKTVRGEGALQGQRIAVKTVRGRLTILIKL